MMLMIHEAGKPSVATKLISFMIGLHLSSATHGYHQPCDLLNLSYEPTFSFRKNIKKQNVQNKMIIDTLSWVV